MAIRKKAAPRTAKAISKPKQVAGSATATATATAPPREAIARRAYELYLARGGKDGDAQGDWFTAEQEMLEDR